jgi:hypothetical protein
MRLKVTVSSDGFADVDAENGQFPSDTLIIDTHRHMAWLGPLEVEGIVTNTTRRTSCSTTT